MSKIICEVCGTAYPETSGQCPICGTVRPADAVAVTVDEEQGSSAYHYVKGGRFSKSNVRKRNMAKQSAVPVPADEADPAPSSNKGLVITAVALILAIIAVLIYIAVRLLGGWLLPDSVKPDQTDPLDTQSATATQEIEKTCTKVTLNTSVVELDGLGKSLMLYPSVSPADTTDKVFFATSDPNVATVSANGKITATGAGQAIITVTCGSVTAECRVVCVVEETTEPSTEPSTEPTVSAEDFRLNREDITFSVKNSTWVLYRGEIKQTDIVWTSDNEKIATIKDGTVTAVGPGTTKVHGEYNGVKRSCIIRNSFDADEEIQGSGGNITEGGSTGSTGTASGTYQLYNPFGSAADVTISVGSSFTLSLKDENGNTVTGVTWSSSNTDICTVSNGTITAVAPSGTGAVITATYNGQSYTCIVRVSG